MTPEAQRIAIAEVCGWIPCEPKMYNEGMHGLRQRATHAFTKDGDYYGGLNSIPHYLNNLNAMHEAEGQLATGESGGWSQRKYYAAKLGEVTNNDNGRGWQPLSNADCFPILHATAAQRAEAFLKCLGLWIP